MTTQLRGNVVEVSFTQNGATQKLSYQSLLTGRADGKDWIDLGTGTKHTEADLSQVMESQLNARGVNVEHATFKVLNEKGAVLDNGGPEFPREALARAEQLQSKLVYETSYQAGDGKQSSFLLGVGTIKHVTNTTATKDDNDFALIGKTLTDGKSVEMTQEYITANKGFHFETRDMGRDLIQLLDEIAPTDGRSFATKSNLSKVDLQSGDSLTVGFGGAQKAATLINNTLSDDNAATANFEAEGLFIKSINYWDLGTLKSLVADNLEDQIRIVGTTGDGGSFSGMLSDFGG